MRKPSKSVALVVSDLREIQKGNYSKTHSRRATRWLKKKAARAERQQLKRELSF